VRDFDMANTTIKADVLVKNANIITIDPKQPLAESLAIIGGKFVAVGRNEDVKNLEGPATKIWDFEGHTIIPGLIDAHIHVLSSGIRHVMCADCDQRSIGEIINVLRERADITPAGEWVQGFKFDDTKTSENRFLTKEDLDQVSTKHPIFVSHRAGHVYYVNSLGLALASVNSTTPDPPGGRFGRNPDSGELNGVVYERAVEKFHTELLPKANSEIRRKGIRLVNRMFTEAGLTSVHDAMTDSEDLASYQEARDSDDLTLRIYALMHRDAFPALRDAGLRTGFGDNRLRLGGIKMVSDGAIASRTAYLSEPYIGSETDRGILAMSPEETEEWVMEIHRSGFQVCVHSNGDSAIAMVLEAYAKAQASFPRTNPRHRIEHCTLVNQGIIDKMKALGVIATPFCTYVYYHGEKMRYYGNDRVNWMFAQRSFLDNGVVSTGATDYPPGPFQPLMGIQSCVTRTDMNGNQWGVNQRISVEEALKIYTLHGAYASFEEDTKGSIQAGKLADFVVLEENPTNVDPLSIKDIAIIKTVIGGKIVYEQ
jgi:predicted amidohydrolase YtcJ